MHRWGEVVEHPLITLTVVVTALSIPYFLAGPHFLADDFIWLRNAHFDGWWNAGGARTVGRPGGWLAAALTFGAIGARPALLYVLQTTLRLVAAVCLFRCLAEFLRAGHALAVVLVWVVMANHLALEMWLSTIAAPAALALVAEGTTQLARALRDDRRRQLVGAYLLLAAAVAMYELTGAVAVLAVIVVPYLVHRRPSIRWTAVGLVVVLLPAVWAAIRSTVYDHGATGRLDARLVLPGNLSLGLAPFGAQGRLVQDIAIAALLFATVRLVHPRLRSSAGFPERLTLAGAAVIILGVLPLASFDTNFFGMHDRLTLMSGVGAAMLWTGAALVAGELLRRRAVVAIACAVAFLLVTIPVRFIRTRDYERAGQEAMRQTHAIADRARLQPALDIPGPIADFDRVWGLNDGWNTTAAVQVAVDDRDVAIGVIIYGERVGPAPNRPAAQF